MAKYQTYKYDKNSKTYYRCVAIVGRLDNGKPNRIESSAVTKKVAEAKMEEKLKSVATGKSKGRTGRNNLYLNDWVDSFLKEYKSINLKQTTLDQYESLYKAYINPYFKGYHLRSLTTSRIQKFINFMYRDKGLSASTIRSTVNVISTAIDKAVKLGYTDFNPTADAELPPIKKSAVDALNAVEIEKLFNALNQEFYGYAIKLCISSGLRRGELLGLQWTDIDLEGSVIHVKNNLVKTSKGCLLQSPKTKSSVRDIVISDDVCTMLKKRRKEYPDDIYFVRQLSKDQPVNPDNFSRQYRCICEKAGIKGTGIHRLRHTFATIAFQAGIFPKITQEQLGHSDLKTTMKTYTHLNHNAVKTAVNVIEDRLKGYTKNVDK
mgnify:FL=1